MVAYLKGKIYPSRKFSIGVVPHPKKKKEEKSYDRDYNEQFVEWTEYVNEYGRTVRKERKLFCGREQQVGLPKARNHHESTSASQLPKEKKRYGLKGITQKGRITVENCCILMQQKYGLGRLGFGTCTMPEFPEEITRVINANWSEVTRRFYQKLKRSLEKLGAPSDYVGSSEVQPARWKNSGKVGLHIHFVYLAMPRKKAKFYIDADMFRYMWRTSVQEVLKKFGLSHACNQKMFQGSFHGEVVRDCAASYLGKYISKGMQITKEVIDAGKAEQLPNQWWTASVGIKKEFLRKTISMATELAIDFFHNIESYVSNGDVLRYGYAYAYHDGEEKIFGLGGTLSKRAYDFMKLYHKRE